jgi:hypothetical protein
MTTMTLRSATHAAEPSSADSARKAAPRDGAAQPRPATSKLAAATVSFNWQLQADGVQDAIERIYR